ncbi:MAG: hypothetical protein AMS18_13785 [Gemmatimonas sp. SG8_17]|nr:MAG: hypothetical protein AMS18_13785 [Gemmatimonas sp. SG8_17]
MVQEYHVDLAADNVVRFVSDAPIEDFDGVTDRIDGYVLLGQSVLSETVGGSDTKFYFEVDLASIDTGIGLRNRHMRDNYLEVNEYPYATYGGVIESVVQTAPDGYRVTASGTFSIHGRERPMEIPCDITTRSEGYRTRCSFHVLLTDFDIKIPRVMFLKIADEIQLELDFSLAPAANTPGGRQ